jgi:hypothetical protein
MPEPTVVLGELAEDFTEKVRNGHAPDIEAYASQHPEIAERIRELFPALMLLEGLAAAPSNATVDQNVADPSATLPPGTIFGQYRIVREIACGGMGIVYEAEHLTLHRQVALKVLPIAGPQAAKQLERFLREAKTAAGLHHTNIVPVFDVGQVRGTPYYAMQYIPGQSLDSVISSAKSAQSAFPNQTQITPITLRGKQVAAIGIQAAAGLAHAHERGVIHRDIKPSNLLLDDRGVVWITDFGLARREDDIALTHSGQILGTPRYMSPEQAEAASKPLDHRTDIYSLGATLYELLTRRPAFDGPTPQDVVKQIIAREPIRPRQLDPHVPRDLETIIMKAMAKRPDDRYPTAQALADDLERFTNGEPIQARRIGIVGRAWRWAKREPVVAGLTAIAGTFLLIGMVTATLFGLHAKQQNLAVRGLVIRSAFDLSHALRAVDPFKSMLWLAEPLKYFKGDEQVVSTSLRSLAINLRYTAVSEDGHQYLFASRVENETDTPWQYMADDLDPAAFLDRCQRMIWTIHQTHYWNDNETIRGNLARLARHGCFGTDSSMGLAIFDESAPPYAFHIWSLTYDSPISPPMDSITDPAAYPELTITELEALQRRARIVIQPETLSILRPLSNPTRWYEIRWIIASFECNPSILITLTELLACHRLVHGEYFSISLDEARSAWSKLVSLHPDVFTVPIDDLLAWHLKDDEASIEQKHRHAALFAANFDCRDRPNDPHPFVARGRLFTVLGEWDKAEADFAKAWQLGGTGWVKSEARRLGRDALNTANQEKTERPELQSALRKAEIANKYLLPIGPHRWARAFARYRLGLPLDAADQATLDWPVCGLLVGR